MDKRKMPAGILAADYKARGIERQEAWSRFVQDRRLSPGMDAPEFYEIYDDVRPQKLSTTASRVDTSDGWEPTHFDTVTEIPVQIEVRDGTRYLVWENGLTGHEAAHLLKGRYEQLNE